MQMRTHISFEHDNEFLRYRPLAVIGALQAEIKYKYPYPSAAPAYVIPSITSPHRPTFKVIDLVGHTYTAYLRLGIQPTGILV